MSFSILLCLRDINIANKKEYSKLDRQLVYSYWKNMLLHGNSVRVNGMKLDIAGSVAEAQYIVREVFIKSIYYFKCDKNSPLIVDMGSNIGLSILYFKTLYPESRIIGFEPVKKTYDILTNNLKNNCKNNNVMLHNIGLYDAAGSKEFYIKPGRPEMNSIIKNSDEAIKEVVQLDLPSKYINEHVDLLKIDTEGSEDGIIRDLDKNGKLKMVKRIIMEYHFNMIGNKPLEEILSTLDKNGFTYYLNSSTRNPFRGFQEDYEVMMIYAINKNL